MPSIQKVAILGVSGALYILWLNISVSLDHFLNQILTAFVYLPRHPSTWAIPSSHACFNPALPSPSSAVLVGVATPHPATSAATTPKL
jgi:hypothetical protein